MNTTDMLAQLRLNCQIEDGAVDYPDSVLLREMSDALTTKFQDTIVGFRNGIWLTSYYDACVAGKKSYRIRQSSTVLSKVEIGIGSTSSLSTIDFSRLVKLEEGHTDLFEGAKSTTGTPVYYAIRGGDIVLFPTPDSTGFVLRVSHYRKPSTLTPAQPLAYGNVNSVNASTAQIGVAVLPFDYSDPLNPVAVGGTVRIDIVRTDGWFEPIVGDVQATVSGTTFTIITPCVLDSVVAGDRVRVYGQSEWPVLPVDFHRCVVDVASSKILIQRGYQQKAANFAGDVTADLTRFENLYGNLVREETRKIRAPLNVLRRARLR